MSKNSSISQVQDMLLHEKEELANILQVIKNREILAENINDVYDEHSTLGDRLADKIADFGGSWKFILSFLGFLVIWMAVNTFLASKSFDPFPFILLNLVLSCTAALQAPVIMMSQNRQEARDRIRAENDYKVNIKSELEIRSLHDKIDHLLSHKWDHLIEIQQIQLSILEENITTINNTPSEKGGVKRPVSKSTRTSGDTKQQTETKEITSEQE